MRALRPAKMAEIVNLRGVRKAKTKAEKEKAADANRVLHGTPKAVKKLAEARTEKARQTLAGHKLEPHK
jgi:uncharacterized protein YicC (UPF0701 family)